MKSEPRVRGERSDPSRPIRVRATAFEQRDATVGDLRLRYIDVGAPSPSGDPLVLVHGLTSRLEEYEELVGPLSRTRRVIVPDLPGSGYSDKPDRRYSLAYCEDVIVGFLDSLGIARADIGGGSLGGNIALRLAHRYPSRFGRVVAWAPAGAWQPSRFLSWACRVLGRPWLFHWILRVHSRFWFEEKWPGRERALRETFDYYDEVSSPGFRRMYFELMRDQIENSLFGCAPQIRQPTLLLWGDRDHALDMGSGLRRLVGLIPKAELRVFRGVRHSLALEIPDRLSTAIREFLDNVKRHSFMPPPHELAAAVKELK